MKISTVMSRKVATASSRTTLLTVSRVMSEKKISCVIITEKDRLLGIISERDIVRKLAATEGDFTGTTAGKVMSTPVETLWSDTTLDRGVTLMAEKGFRRFPILNRKGRLVGIVT